MMIYILRNFRINFPCSDSEISDMHLIIYYQNLHYIKMSSTYVQFLFLLILSRIQIRCKKLAFIAVYH